MFVMDFVNRKRRVYVDNLKSCSLASKILLYSYASGNSVGSLHFIWKIPEESSEEMLVSRNAEVSRIIKPSIPIYHTRAMKKQFYSDMSLFRCGRPAVLREMYKRLTGELSTCIQLSSSVSHMMTFKITSTCCGCDHLTHFSSVLSELQTCQVSLIGCGSHTWLPHF